MRVLVSVALLVAFLSGCGKSEVPSSEQGEGAKASMSSEGARSKAPTNVPLEQYVELSNSIDRFTPQQGFDLVALNAAVSQVDPKFPLDFDLLARLASKEYDSTQDAFKKRELMATLQPKLEERIAHFKANPYIALVYTFRNNIEGYDFTRQAFPINVFKAERFFYPGNSQLIHFEVKNEAASSYFPVSDEALAKRIETLRTSGSTPRLKAYFVADRKPPNSYASAFGHYFTNEIPLTVTHLELVDRDGTVLADFAPDQSDTPKASSEVQADAASIANGI